VTFFGQKENINLKYVGIPQVFGKVLFQMLKRVTYKYRIHSSNDGVITEKADPFAYCEKPPHTASVVWDLIINGRILNG
jgi:hypothetical protein